MDIKDILNKVEDYDSFFTIEELDRKAKELSEKYGFELLEVGKNPT